MITRFSKSDLLSKRARELIPGGGHTYSKGADQSPLLGPKLISHGKGSHIWDVDGNEYIDWAMGLTSVALGHAYEPVLEAVRQELPRGSNFQCPSPLEVEYAEAFLAEVPGAEMVKFAKNGSTVTTAAVKLARAYTGRKYVAFCADHGFFSYDDWYIGKKPNNSGVPPETAELSLTFNYNNIASLEALFAQYPNQIACVILEPMEFDFPENGFLAQVRELCTKNGALLVIDEMITGFRIHHPGAHRLFEVEPDLTTWGKGVGNGFSLCVLAGKREFMRLGGIDHTDRERVFLISTTHGAETHALAAGLACLREMKSQNSVARNIAMGEVVRERFRALVSKHGLSRYLRIKGHPAWQLVQFLDHAEKPCDGMKTLFFQETIRHGIFFRGTFVPTISHTAQDLEDTFNAFDEVLKTYAAAIEAKTYQGLLVGEPIRPVFRKFN